ncbi:hypothetical protein [Pseudonocardia endophytica]|uniref:Uncharacterized protein n=1 Tax=Pseudonocardia endophytica TaxID=401976 RepID=A0A4R1HVP1_PSEEN|nr:hypothetical protein [Pseudonocardia endophytica]TCK24790.1 hypothetical protein EV378_0583 [Pseudonocardia endophytica]
MTARIVAFRPLAALTVPLAACLVLAGCGSAPAAAPSSPSTAVAPQPAGAPVTTGGAPPTAADGTDYAACRDGSCTVEARPGTTIAFDESLRVSSFRIVAIDGDRISMATRNPNGGSGSTTTGSGGSGQINGLAYRVLDVRDGAAILQFQPA